MNWLSFEITRRRRPLNLCVPFPFWTVLPQLAASMPWGPICSRCQCDISQRWVLSAAQSKASWPWGCLAAWTPGAGRNAGRCWCPASREDTRAKALQSGVTLSAVAAGHVMISSYKRSLDLAAFLRNHHFCVVFLLFFTVSSSQV